MVSGHRCGGCPSEVVVEYLPQRRVACQSDIGKRLVEAKNCTAIHFFVLAIAAVHPDDAGLVAIQLGVRARTAERLSPVSGKSLHVLRMEAVAECMADDLIGHHSIVPRFGQAMQAFMTTRRFESSAHVPMMPASRGYAR